MGNILGPRYASECAWALPGTDTMGSGHNRAMEHANCYTSYALFKSVAGLVQVKESLKSLTCRYPSFWDTVQKHVSDTLHAL